jgi:hypothetical protein
VTPPPPDLYVPASMTAGATEAGAIAIATVDGKDPSSEDLEALRASALRIGREVRVVGPGLIVVLPADSEEGEEGEER